MFEEKMNFMKKWYGRIFVEKEEDIAKVKQIIKEMDKFEYEYLPDDLIAVYDKDTEPDTTYTHKFDALDLGQLMFNCWNKGIHVFCVTGLYGHAVFLEKGY